MLVLIGTQAIAGDTVDVAGLTKYQDPAKKYDPFFFYPETFILMKSPEGIKKMFAEKEKVGIYQDRISIKEVAWPKAATDHITQEICDVTAASYKKTYAESFGTTEDKVKTILAQAGVKKNPNFGGADRDFCYVQIQIPYEQGFVNVYFGLYHSTPYSGPMDVLVAFFEEGSVNTDALIRSVKAFSQK